MVQRLMYVSALRRTPARTVSQSSGRVFGRESSRSAGRVLPVNSSCTDRLACLRHTESSYIMLGCHATSLGRVTYSGNSKEHDNQLFLGKNGMSYERIREAHQPSPSLLEKASIGGYRRTVD
jgi:hypothetical protein